MINNFVGLSKFATQKSKKIRATAVALVFAVSAAFASLVYRSVINTTIWLRYVFQYGSHNVCTDVFDWSLEEK